MKLIIKMDAEPAGPFYLGFCRSINFTSHIARSLARSLTPVTQILDGKMFF